MAVVMRKDDEIRLNILSALLKQGSVTPNLRQIQKYTGYHKATIKSSLDFLSKEGLLGGYGPKIDFKKFGYELEVLTFFQSDLTKKKKLTEFVNRVKNDDNIYFLSGVLGSGNWNLMARHIYSDIESYHKGMNEKYFSSIPGIYDLIKGKEIFYVTEPFYKQDSRTESLIKTIKKSKGM